MKRYINLRTVLAVTRCHTAAALAAGHIVFAVDPYLASAVACTLASVRIVVPLSTAPRSVVAALLDAGIRIVRAMDDRMATATLGLSSSSSVAAAACERRFDELQSRVLPGR